MNKRGIFILLILSVILCRSCSHLSSGQDLGREIAANKDFILDGTALIGYIGSATRIIIPNGVTFIGDYAFAINDNIESITIPVSVTSIGDEVFYICENLVSITVDAWNPAYSSEGGVLFNKDRTILIQYPEGKQENIYTIPTGVTSIGDSAFRWCTNLTSVTIPASVTSIGIAAFHGCSNLTSITVDAWNPAYSSEGGVLFNKDRTILIQYPVGKQENIYTIPEGVISIGDGTYADYIRYIPWGHTEIIYYGWGAFSSCRNLTSVIIPASVTSIGDSAFSRCTNLTSVTISVGVTSIGDSAFYGCSSLTSINIPASVTSIGNYAFSGSSLTSVTIPASVTSIGNYAFSGSSLTSVIIPASVTSIGNYAFSGSSLTSITVDTQNPAYSSLEGVLFNKNKTILVLYPFCKQESTYAIPAGVTSISDWAFAQRSLTSVTIPVSVTSIGDFAFYGSSLTSVTIPASVTSIGDSAFLECRNLISVTIPASVTSIGDGVFSDCGRLTSINIPASVTSISNFAFSRSSLNSITVDTQNPAYSSLKGVLFNKNKTILVLYPSGKQESTYAIPAGVTSIGDNAFSGSRRLTNITIPSSVTSIGDGAFSWCTSLTSITIPASVTSIGDSAFRWCTNLISVIIPASVTSIGNYAFSGSRLTSVTIPASVTFIGDRAFSGSTSITVDTQNPAYSSLEGVLFNKNKTILVLYPSGKQESTYAIPAGVTSIGDSAFSGSRLTNITIPSSVTSIGDGAFWSCTNLTSVTIPSSVTSIGNAFRDSGLKTIVISRKTSFSRNAFSSDVQIIYSD